MEIDVYVLLLHKSVIGIYSSKEEAAKQLTWGPDYMENDYQIRKWRVDGEMSEEAEDFEIPPRELWE